MESPKQFNVILHTWTALLQITYNQHKCTHMCARAHMHKKHPPTYTYQIRVKNYFRCTIIPY